MNKNIVILSLFAILLHINIYIVGMHQNVSHQINLQKQELQECQNLGSTLSQITEQWNNINPDQHSQPGWVKSNLSALNHIKSSFNPKNDLFIKLDGSEDTSNKIASIRHMLWENGKVSVSNITQLMVEKIKNHNKEEQKTIAYLVMFYYTNKDFLSFLSKNDSRIEETRKNAINALKNKEAVKKAQRFYRQQCSESLSDKMQELYQKVCDHLSQSMRSTYQNLRDKISIYTDQFVDGSEKATILLLEQQENMDIWMNDAAKVLIIADLDQKSKNLKTAYDSVIKALNIQPTAEVNQLFKVVNNFIQTTNKDLLTPSDPSYLQCKRNINTLEQKIAQLTTEQKKLEFAIEQEKKAEEFARKERLAFQAEKQQILTAQAAEQEKLEREREEKEREAERIEHEKIAAENARRAALAARPPIQQESTPVKTETPTGIKLPDIQLKELQKEQPNTAFSWLSYIKKNKLRITLTIATIASAGLLSSTDLQNFLSDLWNKLWSYSY